MMMRSSAYLAGINGLEPPSKWYYLRKGSVKDYQTRNYLNTIIRMATKGPEQVQAF